MNENKVFILRYLDDGWHIMEVDTQKLEPSDSVLVSNPMTGENQFPEGYYRLRNIYDRFFHAVCKQSSVYKESESKPMSPCDWSILIDDFDAVCGVIAHEFEKLLEKNEESIHKMG